MKCPALLNEVSVFLNRLMAFNDQDHCAAMVDEFCSESCIWVTTELEKPLSSHIEISEWLQHLFSKVEIVHTDYELQRCEMVNSMVLIHVLYKVSYYFINVPEQLLYISIRTSYVLEGTEGHWKINLAHSSVAGDHLLKAAGLSYPDPFF